MTIYSDSYQTTVGSMISADHIKKIQYGVKEFAIKNSLHAHRLDVAVQGEFTPFFVVGSNADEDGIPLFPHPILVSNTSQGNLLASDLRFFVRKDTPIDNVESSIRNLTEYNFARSRTILNLLWVNHGVSRVKNTLQFASGVYSSWLSEVISKTYNLDFKDKTVVAIIAHFFYQSLFHEKSVFDKEEKETMAMNTTRTTTAPANLVLEVFDKIQGMSDINDFCTAVTDIVENVRLKNFNPAILLTLVKNSWYGTNAKEVIAVALEHPPTWAAVVYTALTERTYKASTITRIAEAVGKRGGADAYQRSFSALMHELTEVTATESAIFIRDFD